MSAFNQKNHEITWIPVRKLVIRWPDAQRGLKDFRAKEIADSFDPEKFGNITVNPLPDGYYHVADGWHRTNAVKLKFGEDEKVPCVLVPAPNEKKAATLFLGINSTRSKPSAMELFKTAVAAGKERPVAVNELVKSLGLHVSRSSNSRTSVRSPETLLVIQAQFGMDTLRGTLEMIIAVWGQEESPFDANIMRGTALFMTQQEGPVDYSKISKRLSRKFTTGSLLGAAKMTREALRCSMPRAICHIIQQHTNPRRKDDDLGLDPFAEVKSAAVKAAHAAKRANGAANRPSA